MKTSLTIAFSQIGQESDWRTANTDSVTAAIEGHELRCTDGNTKGGEHILNLLILPHTVLLSLLDIKNLTTQRHNSLEYSIASLLGCTTRRITLDEEDLCDATITA